MVDIRCESGFLHCLSPAFSPQWRAPILSDPTGGGKGGGASKREETSGGEGCFVAANTAIHSVAAGVGARAVRLDDDMSRR